jgi:serine/threonine-protein kinase HipA
MTTQPLTIQAYLNDSWQDIAIIEFDEGKKITGLTYLSDYSLEHFLADNHFAASINYPVELFAYNLTHKSDSHWLPFLDDITPAGASRRYWSQRLDLSRLTNAEQNYELLKRATIAPVGHLRIKESLSNLDEVTPIKFSLAEIKDRDVDFLEYASEHGAMAGGATGAGGEAPKLLLRWQNDDAIWIDNHQLTDSLDNYYLVKYPRGSRKNIDCDILRAEYHFYHELHAMGMMTIDTKGMRLVEGERYPSLWLPRFDIEVDAAGNTRRYAMESVYSMLKKGAGSLLDHEQVIRQLIKIIENSQLVAEGFVFDRKAFVIEWVRRDLLNIAFGNSDNHGRNTAFMRDEQAIWLAPIYDFAPMKADPDGIVRTIRWQNSNYTFAPTKPPSEKLESGGDYRFDLIAQTLADLVDPIDLLAELKITANNLVHLKRRLQARGVADRILDYPSISFETLPTKLIKWRLL